MREMTARQREVLGFIRTFTERHGAPPTVREIGERFGFTARAAFDHLRALERKGKLQRRATDKRVSRTLVLAQRPEARPASTRDVPVLGRIAAGTPIHAVQNVESTIPLSIDWLERKGEDIFALRVRGESMIDAHILDGDLVLVRPQASAQSGDIVAALRGRRGHREALRAGRRARRAQARASHDEAHRGRARARGLSHTRQGAGRSAGILGG